MTSKHIVVICYHYLNKNLKKKFERKWFFRYFSKNSEIFS